MNAIDIIDRRETVAKEAKSLERRSVEVYNDEGLHIDCDALVDSEDGMHGTDHPDVLFHTRTHTIVWLLSGGLPLNRDEAAAMFGEEAVSRAEEAMDDSYADHSGKKVAA